MRADADLDQPLAALVERAVRFGRRRVGADIGVARDLVGQVLDRVLSAASISPSERRRMKTGLPRKLTLICDPGDTPATSTRIVDSA